MVCNVCEKSNSNETKSMAHHWQYAKRKVYGVNYIKSHIQINKHHCSLKCILKAIVYIKTTTMAHHWPDTPTVAQN